jgi:hypothetical protein
VSISARHNEIGFQPPSLSNQRCTYVAVAEARVMQRGVDTVTFEMINCIFAQHGPSFGRRVVIDDDNCRFLCLVEIWQCLRQSARGRHRWCGFLLQDAVVDAAGRLVGLVMSTPRSSFSRASVLNRTSFAAMILFL